MLTEGFGCEHCGLRAAFSSRPQASPVRALLPSLSHPAFLGEQGREKWVGPQIGMGSRVATRTAATDRAADACKAPEAGALGARARSQQASGKQCGGTRSKLQAQEPRGAPRRSRARTERSGATSSRAAGSKARGAGHAWPRTSGLGVVMNETFDASPLDKTDCGRVP